MKLNKDENTSNHEFSFKKLYENMISKSGGINTYIGKKVESIAKLRFEPNLNVERVSGKFEIK